MAKIRFHFQRFEYKYQIPQSMIEAMVPELLKYLEFDPFAQNLPHQSYLVTSLYFDSTGFGCYHDKIAGLKMRKKLRIRYYSDSLNPDAPLFFEIKRKYDNVVVKDRVKLTYSQVESLLQRNDKTSLDLDTQQKNTLDEFLWLKNYNSLVPQNLVTYKRRPFMSNVDPGFRVTLDYDLKSCIATSLNSTDSYRSVNPGISVMEVKFNNVLPSWFHSIIQKYNLEQSPFSKYCNSLEVCHPSLVHDGGLLDRPFNLLAYS